MLEGTHGKVEFKLYIGTYVIPYTNNQYYNRVKS